REFTVCAWQLEYQLAAFDFHRGLGKHAALSSRENISDAHRRPQHPRTIEHSCCCKLSQPRGQVLFTQSGVTKNPREREVRPSGMINCDERPVRDDVHGLLAAIVRVSTPADVREQTGGMPQSTLVGTFVQL